MNVSLLKTEPIGGTEVCLSQTTRINVLKGYYGVLANDAKNKRPTTAC